MGTTGIWSIGSEVGVEVTKATLKEVYAEMKILREEPVSQEELDTVKSYMLGVFLKMWTDRLHWQKNTSA